MIQKKWKYLCLIFSCFLFSGCTAEYNLNIGLDLSLYENITIEDGEDKYNKAEELIANVKETYGHEYTIYQHVIDYEFEEVVRYYGVVGNKSYDTLSSISSSTIIDEYFGTASITKSGNVYTLNATPENQLAALLTDVNYVKASLQTLEVNVFVPYKVTSHNADSVNENTYTWKYNARNSSKKIELTFDISDETVYNDNIDNNTGSSNTSENANNNTWKFVLILIAIGVIGVILYFIRLKDKNNSI